MRFNQGLSMICNRVGWEMFYYKNSVLGYPAARWQHKKPNQVGSLEFRGSVYSSSTLFFLGFNDQKVIVIFLFPSHS